MKSLLIALLITLYTTALHAECSEWYPGSVRLDDGTVMYGNVQYCLDHDLVILKKENRLLTFSSLNADYFSIYDYESSMKRIFVTLPYEGIKDYKRDRFFELLYHGKISLLNRGSEVLITEEQMQFGETILQERLINIDNYYLMDEAGKVIPYSGNLKDLIEYFGDQSDDVRDILRKHKLNSSERDGIITVLNYYDAIQ